MLVEIENRQYLLCTLQIICIITHKLNKGCSDDRVGLIFLTISIN